jgi:hypothetical protein
MARRGLKDELAMGDFRSAHSLANSLTQGLEFVELIGRSVAVDEPRRESRET